MTEVKIVSLQAENFMRLQAVMIRPDGQLIEITGRNKQGKSSVLNAIWAALEGAKAIHAEPIRRGAEEAVIKLDLGKYRVTRRFRRRDDGTIAPSIIVESVDGARFQKPESTLRELLGALSFDPMRFFMMPPKAQFDIMKSFVTGVDFDDLERGNAGDFTKRTDVNRAERTLRARIGALTLPADAPAERIDEAGLIAELDRAGAANAAAEKERARRTRVSDAIDQRRAKAAAAREDAASLRAQAERLDREAEECDASAARLEKELEADGPPPEMVSTSAIRQRIAEAAEANRRFDDASRIRAEIDRLTAEADLLSKQSDGLTAAITERTARKEAAIAASEMPVPGLSFGNGEILFNGLPLDQASKAERIRLSVAIAARLSGGLRVALIEDGSLLDEESWAALAEMADALGCQIFAETVSSDRPGAIVIEDGLVRIPAEAAE